MWHLLLFLTFLVPARALTACDVLCAGPILEAVVTVSPPVFNDSKTFVDLVLLKDPEDILKAFAESQAATNRTALIEFLAQYMAPTHGTDVFDWVPPDFQDEIPWFDKITDPVMQAWAKKVHAVWKTLGKQIDKDVYTNPFRHTLLPLKYPYMIVPGGRFIEFYYWDTYWIIKGLLISQMTDTAIMVVENLLQLANATGFVPNGSRQYYLNRSQPPYLTLMVELLVQAKVVNATWVEAAVPVLSAEYKWWMQDGKHAVTIHQAGKDYVLNRFYSDASVPRAESAREDVITAAGLPPNEQKKDECTQKSDDQSSEEKKCVSEVAEVSLTKVDVEGVGADSAEMPSSSSHTESPESESDRLWKVYQALTAGAEAGWDYTSRWFSDGQTLRAIDTLNVIPADLNGVFHRVEVALGQLYEYIGKVPPMDYAAAAEQRKIAIHDVLWDSQYNQWRDYNYTARAQMPNSSPANFLGLWAGVLDTKLYGVTVEDIARSFVYESGLIGPGGVCATLSPTGQQWDYPNVWPPLISMLVEGFMGVQHPKQENELLSASIAKTMLQGALIAFNETKGYMLEKYNCSELGALGGGGEYDLQTGFGWTNGVVLSLLDQFPDTPAPPGFELDYDQYV